MLVAKWFTQNDLGSFKKNVVWGICAWFLKNLIYDSIPQGLCIYQVVVDSLGCYKEDDRLPLPFITTMIMAKVFNFQRDMVVEFPMKSP